MSSKQKNNIVCPCWKVSRGGSRHNTKKVILHLCSTLYMPYKVGHVLEKEKGTAKQFTFIAIWFNTEVNTKMSKERDCTVYTSKDTN